MEIIANSIACLFVVGLITIPILLLRIIIKSNIRFKMFSYFVIGLITTALIALIFAWWANISNLMLLKHYGYDISGINKAEIYKSVPPKDIEKVKSLEINIMGIGWPLKAIITFIFYSPYLIIVYFLNYIIVKIKLKKQSC